MKAVLRKPVVVAAAILVSSLGLVQQASKVSAEVTATTVTSVTGVPVGYTIDNLNAASQPTVTAKGTAAGAVAGDHVDVRCYYDADSDDGYSPLAEDVAVNSGHWTASGSLSDISGSSCQLVAVPASASVVLDDPSSAVYGRSRLLNVGQAQHDQISDGHGHVTNYDDYLSIPMSKANIELDSATGCGPYFRLTTTSLERGNYLWDCVVDLYTGDGSEDGDAAINDPVRIDGHSAQTGYALKDDGPTLPLSHGDLRYSYSQNASTGDATVVETDPYYFCQTASHTIDDWVGPQDCAVWLYSGVTLHRATVMNHGGQSVSVIDQFVSTNKTKQKLSLAYENDLGGNDVVVRLPGSSTYASNSDDAIDTSSWPSNGSLYAQDDPATPNGSVDTPLGSLTWSTRPTSAYIDHPDLLFLNYTRSIPAHGSFTITHRVAMAANQDSLKSMTAANQKANVPALRLKHVPAKTRKPSLTVHGTVLNGGNGPITKVIAKDGHHHYTAAVTKRGTFTLHLKLKAGVNHISVTGSDPTRSKASAKATVHYKPRHGRHRT